MNPAINRKSISDAINLSDDDKLATISNLNETALGSVPRGCIIAFDMIWVTNLQLIQINVYV